MKKDKDALVAIKKVVSKTTRVGRAKAVKEYCLCCCGGSPAEVTLCSIVSCPLWFWRFGVPMTSKNAIRRMERAFVRNRAAWMESFSDLEEK